MKKRTSDKDSAKTILDVLKIQNKLKTQSLKNIRNINNSFSNYSTTNLPHSNTESYNEKHIQNKPKKSAIDLNFQKITLNENEKKIETEDNFIKSILLPYENIDMIISSIFDTYLGPSSSNLLIKILFSTHFSNNSSRSSRGFLSKRKFKNELKFFIRNSIIEDLIYEIIVSIPNSTLNDPYKSLSDLNSFEEMNVQLIIMNVFKSFSKENFNQDSIDKLFVKERNSKLKSNSTLGFSLSHNQNQNPSRKSITFHNIDDNTNGSSAGNEHLPISILYSSLLFLLFCNSHSKNIEDNKNFLINKSSLLFNLIDYNSKGFIVSSSKFYKHILKLIIYISLFFTDNLINSIIFTNFTGYFFPYDILTSKYLENFSIKKQLPDIITFKKMLILINDTDYMKDFINYISNNYIFIENKIENRINSESFVESLTKTDFYILKPSKIRYILVYYILNRLKNDSKLFFEEVPKMINYYYDLSNNIVNDRIQNTINYVQIKRLNLEVKYKRYDNLFSKDSLYEILKAPKMNRFGQSIISNSSIQSNVSDTDNDNDKNTKNNLENKSKCLLFGNIKDKKISNYSKYSNKSTSKKCSSNNVPVFADSSSLIPLIPSNETHTKQEKKSILRPSYTLDKEILSQQQEEKGNHTMEHNKNSQIKLQSRMSKISYLSKTSNHSISEQDSSFCSEKDEKEEETKRNHELDKIEEEKIETENLITISNKTSLIRKESTESMKKEDEVFKKKRNENKVKSNMRIQSLLNSNSNYNTEDISNYKKNITACFGIDTKKKRDSFPNSDVLKFIQVDNSLIDDESDDDISKNNQNRHFTENIKLKYSYNKNTEDLNISKKVNSSIISMNKASKDNLYMSFDFEVENKFQKTIISKTSNCKIIIKNKNKKKQNKNSFNKIKKISIGKCNVIKREVKSKSSLLLDHILDKEDNEDKEDNDEYSNNSINDNTLINTITNNNDNAYNHNNIDSNNILEYDVKEEISNNNSTFSINKLDIFSFSNVYNSFFAESIFKINSFASIDDKIKLNKNFFDKYESHLPSSQDTKSSQLIIEDLYKIKDKQYNNKEDSFSELDLFKFYYEGLLVKSHIDNINKGILSEQIINNFMFFYNKISEFQLNSSIKFLPLNTYFLISSKNYDIYDSLIELSDLFINNKVTRLIIPFYITKLQCHGHNDKVISSQNYFNSLNKLAFIELNYIDNKKLLIIHDYSMRIDFESITNIKENMNFYFNYLSNKKTINFSNWIVSLSSHYSNQFESNLFSLSLMEDLFLFSNSNKTRNNIKEFNSIETISFYFYTKYIETVIELKEFI